MDLFNEQILIGKGFSCICLPEMQFRNSGQQPMTGNLPSTGSWIWSHSPAAALLKQSKLPSALWMDL
jgi:hypothetical protein